MMVGSENCDFGPDDGSYCELGCMTGREAQTFAYDPVTQIADIKVPLPFNSKLLVKSYSWVTCFAQKDRTSRFPEENAIGFSLRLFNRAGMSLTAGKFEWV